MTTVRDELEKLIVESGYLQNAPFEWVTISLRYGLKNELVPHYESINKEYRDLPLAIELDVRELANYDRPELEAAFERAVLRALIHAAEKFKLPHSLLSARLAE